MCEDSAEGFQPYTRLSDADFAALWVSAGGAAGEGAGGAPELIEKDVVVATPDGACDAALVHPKGAGPWPGVLMWPDAIALRPELRDMAKRLAANGYVVLVPNQYYRSMPAPEIVAAGLGHDREKRDGMRALITAKGLENDIRALVAFLDAQFETSDARLGVHGYCMGGTFAFRSVAAVPERIGAVGSFHGGKLVSNDPDSPHLAIGRTSATYLVCVARDDDQKNPAAKDVLKQTFAETSRPAEVEVYAADHGWCVLGHKKHDPAEAERAWAKLVALYKAELG